MILITSKKNLKILSIYSLKKLKNMVDKRYKNIFYPNIKINNYIFNTKIN